MPDLKEYKILNKYSCLETLADTNEPNIVGKKYKLVHFVQIELPSKVCLTFPEEYLSRANPRYYHTASCEHWRMELSFDKMETTPLVSERLRALGLGGDLIEAWEFSIENAYFAKNVYPPTCPCGGKQSVRERKQGGVVRLHLQCHPTCELSRLARKCWYRRPFPHCPVCREKLGRNIPLMKVDLDEDGMGPTNFSCEICHNSLDKFSIWKTDLLKYMC